MAVGGAACPTLPGDLGLLDEILAAGRRAHRRDVTEPRRPAHRTRDSAARGNAASWCSSPTRAPTSRTPRRRSRPARCMRRTFTTCSTRHRKPNRARGPSARSRRSGRPARERGFHRRRRARAPDRHLRRGDGQGVVRRGADHRLQHRRRPARRRVRHALGLPGESVADGCRAGAPRKVSSPAARSRWIAAWRIVALAEAPARTGGRRRERSIPPASSDTCAPGPARPRRGCDLVLWDEDQQAARMWVGGVYARARVGRWTSNYSPPYEITLRPFHLRARRLHPLP